MSIVCQNRRHRRGQRRLSTRHQLRAPGIGHSLPRLARPLPIHHRLLALRLKFVACQAGSAAKRRSTFLNVAFRADCKQAQVVAATRSDRNMRRRKSIHVRNTWTDCGVQCMARGLVCNLLTTTLHGVCRLGSPGADGRCLPLASWR